MDGDKEKADNAADNEDEMENDPTWAWVALIGIYYSVFLVNGVARSYGILYVEFLDLFGQGPFLTGWVSSTFSICHTVLAPVFGFIADRWNVRWFVIASGLLGMSGLLVSGFATNLAVVIAGYGILTGTANTIAFSCCISMLNKYFTKRRGLANGIAFSGSGLGASTLPFLYQYMSTEYSVRGAMIVAAGFWVNLCVTGALLRPAPLKGKSRKDAPNKDASDESNCNYYQVSRQSHPDKSFKNTDGPIIVNDSNYSAKSDPNIYTDGNNITHVRVEVHATSDEMYSVTNGVHDSNNYVNHIQIKAQDTVRDSNKDKSEELCKEKVEGKKTLWASLCSVTFITYCLFWFAGLFGFFGILQFIPPHIQDLNMSKTQASTLLSIVGGVDLFSRLLFGAIGDLKFINKKVVLAFNYLISGIATIFFSSLTSWPLIAGYAAVLGLFGGSFMVYMGPLVVEAIGVDYVGTGVGISSMLFGLANTLAPLTFGAVREWAGTYTYAIVGAGSLYLMGTLVLIYSTRSVYASKIKLYMSKL